MQKAISEICFTFGVQIMVTIVDVQDINGWTGILVQ